MFTSVYEQGTKNTCSSLFATEETNNFYCFLACLSLEFCDHGKNYYLKRLSTFLFTPPAGHLHLLVQRRGLGRGRGAGPAADPPRDGALRRPRLGLHRHGRLRAVGRADRAPGPGPAARQVSICSLLNPDAFPNFLFSYLF